MAHSSSCQYIPSDIHVPGLAAIHAEHLSFSFHENNMQFAVENSSFDIDEGKITAIIGESGSGKSTLLRLIYGLLEPTGGIVRYKGWQVPTRKDKLIPGHDAMKLVSQGFDDLNTYANVWDNVASQLPNTDIKRKQDKTAEILQRLRIDHLAKKRVADISGGEKQRVAICRALINEPEVLLMDEPFNQVDASFRDTLQQDIKDIVKETGLTVILVSHDPTEVLALADNLIVMKSGKILDQNNPHVLYSNPSHPYTAQLLAKSNILQVEQAQNLGISSEKPIAIHQEWISISPAEQSTFFVKDVRFRGFYYEIVVSNNEINLHAIITSQIIPQKQQAVDLTISHWISFDH
jgi:ABC-type sugar transport system ATPase subunit